MPVKGGYLLLAGTGGLLLWSGLKGKSWSTVAKDILSGKNPKASLTAFTIQPGTAQSEGFGANIGSGGPVSGAAGDFERYVGVVPYVWAGATPRGWDCSGSSNWVWNHDLGHAIPGYPKPHSFNGRTHGPATGMWMLWLPFHASKIKRASVQQDDICLWQTHMGIAADNQNYISAFDRQEGTVRKPIDGGGPTGEFATFWRFR